MCHPKAGQKCQLPTHTCTVLACRRRFKNITRHCCCSSSNSTCAWRVQHPVRVVPKPRSWTMATLQQPAPDCSRGQGFLLNIYPGNMDPPLYCSFPVSGQLLLDSITLFHRASKHHPIPPAWQENRAAPAAAPAAAAAVVTHQRMKEVGGAWNFAIRGSHLLSLPRPMVSKRTKMRLPQQVF